MSYLNAQDQIVAQVKAIPHIDVYDEEMSDEKFAALIADSNQIKPFVTISFGGFIDPRRRINGIVGAKTHSHDATIVIRCVGSTSRTAWKVWELVHDKLIGFVPTNCSEITAALYGGTGEVSTLGNPARYATVQAYRLLVNSDNDGSTA